MTAPTALTHMAGTSDPLTLIPRLALARSRTRSRSIGTRTTFLNAALTTVGVTARGFASYAAEMNQARPGWLVTMASRMRSWEITAW